MEKFNTIEKKWISSLKSNDPQLILPVLLEIKNSGSVNLLPDLLAMVNKNTDQQVRNEILKFLTEMKSKEAAPIIAESLHKDGYGDYLPALLAACWQSGLDFSKHLRVFAGIFIRGDYLAALESFTVIEESIPNATDNDILECIRFLREAECMVSDEKMPLFNELKKVVESY
ncbi:MAG: hypothetical protein R6X09_09465 [Bacteroidales bacterium]